MTSHEHQKQSGPQSLSCAVVTISDTRTEDNDEGGKFIAESLISAGHQIKKKLIIRDESDGIRTIITEFIGSGDYDLIITTGGTGIASRDNTIQTLKPLLEKTMKGFGEIFRSLSYDEIGARAMLSNATAGVGGSTLLFCLPG